MVDFVKFRGTNHQVVYVDNTLGSGPNDGTAMSAALWNMPLPAAMSGSALYLLRRSSTPYTVFPGNCPNNNVLVVGTPSTSGQMFFTDLPSSVQNAWGVDAATSTTIYVSGSTPNTPWRFGLSDANGGYGLFNIGIYHTNSGVVQKYGLVHLYGPGNIVDSCVFSLSGQPISGNKNLSLTEWTGLHVGIGDGLIINNVDTIGYGYSSSYSSPSSYQLSCGLFIENYNINGVSNCSISNSTFRCVTNQSYNSRSYGIYGRGNFSASKFTNLKFYGVTASSVNQVKTTLFRLEGISNACVFDGISGWSGEYNYTQGLNYGMQFGDGVYIGCDSSYGQRKISKHKFNDIYLYDNAYDLYGGFAGISLGTRYQDCIFTNISIISPSASNYHGAGAIAIGDYSHHNKFDNIYIDNGGDLNQPIPNNSDCYGIYIGGNTSNQSKSKNYITNSIIKCSRYGITSLGSIDISNTSITGGINIYGDSIELNILEAPLSGARFTSPPYLAYHQGGSSEDRQTQCTNNVIKIKNLVNRSAVVGQVVNAGSALVAVECATAAGILNAFAVPNYEPSCGANAGAIYLNNFPQDGYWMAQNAWHKLETSVVQFTTANSVNSGFSLAYSPITNTYFPAPFGVSEQALVVSPDPYKGDEVDTTQTLSAQRQYKAVLYFSTKYASPLTSTDLWFELEIPDGTTGTRTRVISTRGVPNIIETDTSGTVWLGETPLSIYKIELSFILDRQESVYSRIYWNKYLGSPAKAFIAPRIIIED